MKSWCILDFVACVGVFEGGTDGQLAQVCSEFVSGQTIDEYYRASRSKNAQWQPPLLEALELWSTQLFTALVFLHSRTVPIIHRDVKPANLVEPVTYVYCTYDPRAL
jgi:serine/threonine protein kinase